MSAPAITTNFPLAVVVDGIISYLHYAFGNPDMIPPEYRWDSDDRASRIRISAPFVIDNEKPMSAPFIVVERSAFEFADMVIDNLRSGSPPGNPNVEKVDWMDGGINITCGSGVASEASCLANIVALLLHANRHGICETLKFLRSMRYVGIGPEIPVVKYAEVHRWEVTLQMKLSLQFGWIMKQMEITPWNKTDIINVSGHDFSDKGQTVQGSDLLVDITKDFGTLTTNDPQLLSAELSKKYYYIRFKNNDYNQTYPIIQIIDNHTLKLVTHNEGDVEVPWSAPETASGLEYDLLWNHVHLHAKIPGTYS
jgi:hypothetical protein